MSANPNIALLPLEGDLDVRSVPRVKASISHLIDSGCRRIVLSMEHVGYVDSSGMGLLLWSVRRIRSVGGLLSLMNVSPGLMRIFKRYRLVDYAPVSAAGERPVVEELDPSVRPISCNILRVDPDNLAGVRGRVAELLRRMDFTDDALFDMTLAVGEALGNAIDHTSCEGVLATVTLYPDRAVVEVSDCGDGYQLAPGQEPVTSLNAIERGRGIKLMRLLADSVDISLKPSSKGTVVKLVKLVHPQIRIQGASDAGDADKVPADADAVATSDVDGTGPFGSGSYGTGQFGSGSYGTGPANTTLSGTMAG